MTNKEFRNILAKYPDDYIIQIDNSFSWEKPSSKNKVKPHIYVDSYSGFIEIEPEKLRNLWIKSDKENLIDGNEYVVLIGLDIEHSYTSIMTFDKEDNAFKTWDYYDDAKKTYYPDEVIAWFCIPKYNTNDYE